MTKARPASAPPGPPHPTAARWTLNHVPRDSARSASQPWRLSGGPPSTRQLLGHTAGQAAPRRTAVLRRFRVERRAAWWLPSGIRRQVEGASGPHQYCAVSRSGVRRLGRSEVLHVGCGQILDGLFRDEYRDPACLAQLAACEVALCREPGGSGASDEWGRSVGVGVVGLWSGGGWWGVVCWLEEVVDELGAGGGTELAVDAAQMELDGLGT